MADPRLHEDAVSVLRKSATLPRPKDLLCRALLRCPSTL
jgi:hypothetical protein